MPAQRVGLDTGRVRARSARALRGPRLRVGNTWLLPPGEEEEQRPVRGGRHLRSSPDLWEPLLAPAWVRATT